MIFLKQGRKITLTQCLTHILRLHTHTQQNKQVIAMIVLEQC